MGELLESFVAGFAKIFAGALVSDEQRAANAAAGIVPCLSIRAPERSDTLVLPQMPNDPEFAQAMAKIAINATEVMRTAARELLAELQGTEPPAG
jgi:hypothetical protein